MRVFFRKEREARRKCEAVGVKTRVAVLTIVALISFACSDEGGSSGAPANEASPSPSPTFARDTLLLDTEDGSKLIDVEVAETTEQHQLGLMHRESLPPDAGMVFVWFEPQTGGFWMKNTLIPLSIAFFDVDGKIVRILDMEPCESDPCPLYEPETEYLGALEVNQGAFDRWGVGEGDFVRLNR
jgi:uncharacterized membrane protein (UPF0127 family)